MTRILILMTELGFGHKSAAKAIQAAAARYYSDDVTVIIDNPMNSDKAPAILRNLQGDTYDQQVQNSDVYEALYKLGDTPIASAALERVLLLLVDAVEESIKVHQPDVIIAVHENYLAPLQAAFDISKRRIPVITVITDLTTIHRMWYHAVSDRTVVPTWQAQQKALKQRISLKKLAHFGIPVHPDIGEKPTDKNAIRAQLGWQPDITTALVVGSKRVRNLPQKLHGLNHSRLPLQLILVAGGDDALHKQFQQIEWHHPAHIYNFVDNLPTMMHAADLVISKAGGLIVSEALACGLPLLLVDVIPGQETGNATYVVEGGAGDLAETPLTVLETLFHWLADDGALLQQRAEHAANLGKPNAARDIVQLALELTSDGA